MGLRVVLSTLVSKIAPARWFVNTGENCTVTTVLVVNKAKLLSYRNITSFSLLFLPKPTV